MAVSPTRPDVRTAGRRARQQLVGAERDAAEHLLITHVRGLLTQREPQVRSVGAFVAHDGEPDIAPLVEWLWQQGITVALPVLKDDATDYSMQFIPWQQHAPLTPGRYGIPVPESAPPIVPDLVLVSFTGFDGAGNRIGRGGGFFDRYLETYDGSVVGIGFESQLFALVPTEAHDQPLPVVVTDLGIRFTQ